MKTKKKYDILLIAEVYINVLNGEVNRMNLYFIGDTKGLYRGIRIILKDAGIKISKEGMEVLCRKGNCLSVTKKDGKALIVYSEKAEFFRGLSYVLSRDEDFSVEEKKVFTKNGVMWDCSRNAVLSLDTVKYFLRKMALMGLNLCMLYTEDTYAVEGEPYFGYLRGRYSFEELKEIDNYAYALGIEAIPCIQTLSHLERAFQWSVYNDIKNSSTTILVDEEKSYQFIEKMIVEASKPFRTKRIHIGMDEAHDLADGAHKKIYGEQPKHEVMARHMKRVVEIVKKHNLKAMMWSDMHFRASFGAYYTDTHTIPDDVIKGIPKEVEQVYWDYYNSSEKILSHMMDIHKTFPSKTLFAGGIWSWKGAAADYGITMRTTVPALEMCIKKGIKEVFATAWGDNGAETPVLSILYGLQVYAEFGYTGTYDKERTKKRFAECTGENADAFLGMTDFQYPIMKNGRRAEDGFLMKSFLYEDPLLILFEKDFEDFDLPLTYLGLAEKYEKYAKESKSLSDVMAHYSALAEFLYNKALWREIAPFAVRLKDIEKAKEALSVATAMRKSAEKLLKTWRNIWYGRNKPFGFEIIEIRVGGMFSRCVTAEQRMRAFVKGKIKDIPELSEEKLYKLKKENGAIGYCHSYRETIAPCEL